MSFTCFAIFRPGAPPKRCPPATPPSSATACSSTGTISTEQSSAATRASRSGIGTELPDYVSPQITDYARANASVGINDVTLTNVNASALVLTAAYLKKIAALADAAFRPYGIRVYVSARFECPPSRIGNTATADPLDRAVVRFWQEKVEEIYRIIPDFGGFLVKANSEGQRAPATTAAHAEGGQSARGRASGPARRDGRCSGRAFIYANDGREDRAKQAYLELKPLDGSFRENVALQVKCGPIDFQPREPFHPLFGAMPRHRRSSPSSS